MSRWFRFYDNAINDPERTEQTGRTGLIEDHGRASVGRMLMRTAAQPPARRSPVTAAGAGAFRRNGHRGMKPRCARWWGGRREAPDGARGASDRLGD
jgi:hypothetical protein